MLENPPISVVMVCYNASPYIQEAIDSVLNQTFRDFEFIIVDDGSTDDTVDIIKQYCDNRIVFISNTHDYIDSLNVGMNVAKGRYIARMDADGISINTRLELQYNFMETYIDVDIVAGCETFGYSTPTFKRAPLKHNEIMTSLLMNKVLCTPSVMMRKSTLLRIFPNNIIYQKSYVYAEDYKLWVDIIKGGGMFFNLPEVLLKYRRSDSQVTCVTHSEMAMATQRIQGEYAQFILDLLEQKTDIYNDFLNELIELYNHDSIDFYSLRVIVQRIYSSFSSKAFSGNISIKKPKIYVKLIGRIGNNMFQIAAAASLAKKFNCDFIAIPDSYFLPEPDHCYLYEYLQQFKNTIFQNIDFEINYPAQYKLYSEMCFNYKEIPYDENIFISGYFQSEKYFDQELVRELFKIDPDTYNLLIQKYGDLLKEEVTSINVRRGDYLKCSDRHPVCTLEYFNDAIDIIGRDKQFLIISDDLPWCKENFIGTNFYFADRTIPEENLYLQTLCTNNIISNSSFSWWGAWLNPNVNKKVIAPKIWFGSQKETLNTQDLLPDSWLKI